MDNKTFWGILIGIVVVALFLHFRNNSSITTEPSPPAPTPNTPTPPNNNTPTNPPNTNQPTQVVVSNPNGISTYYQAGNPSQPSYPPSYLGPIAGIVFPNGKVLTVVKTWQSYSGQGDFYETTEPIMAAVISQHPEITPHYFIKTTDIQ